LGAKFRLEAASLAAIANLVTPHLNPNGRPFLWKKGEFCSEGLLKSHR
jgi:hypothetical protein